MESLSLKNKQKIAKLPDQIDESKLITSSVMYNNSKKYSLLSYGTEREALFVQSPLFDGIIDCDKYQEYIEYYLKIPQTDEGDKFLKLINNIEKKLMNLAYENKNIWFDKKQENIKFRSLIKNLDDESDNKVIKFRMPHNIKTKRLYVDSIDNLNSSDNEDISVESIGEGLIRLIINVNAIWFTDDMFGLYLRPVYIEEIKQCEYQFQDQVNNTTFFIDSEIAPIKLQQKPLVHVKMDVNKLNNMVSNVKHELLANEKNIIKSLSLSESLNNPTSKKIVLNNSTKEKQIGRQLIRTKQNADSVVIKNEESDSDNLDSDVGSDSEVEINFEDS